MKIGNYEFEFIETISPVMENEQIKNFQPQKEGKPLHKFGEGAFCRFKLKNVTATSGVYAWIIQGETKPIYIGETNNLKSRFNSNYGVIYAANCFKGGRMTNCKMNKVVLDTYKNGRKIDIYFHETKDYKAVEKDLLERITTTYNVKNNKKNTEV